MKIKFGKKIVRLPYLANIWRLYVNIYFFENDLSLAQMCV